MTEEENSSQLPFRKTLIYGYGNPGRQDDGLGNAFVEEMALWVRREKVQDVGLESDYQLNIEDALTIAAVEVVIFVDASIEEDISNFRLTRVMASEATIEFTMHAVSPSFILDLCHKLYQKEPDTFLLHIRGYEWEFKEGITPKARQNLQKALVFLKSHLTDTRSLEKFVQ